MSWLQYEVLQIGHEPGRHGKPQHHPQDYEPRLFLKSLPPFASRSRFCSSSSFMIRSASLIGFGGGAIMVFLVDANTFFFGTVAKTFLGLLSARPIGLGAAFE